MCFTRQHRMGIIGYRHIDDLCLDLPEQTGVIAGIDQFHVIHDFVVRPRQRDEVTIPVCVLISINVTDDLTVLIPSEHFDVAIIDEGGNYGIDAGVDVGIQFVQ